MRNIESAHTKPKLTSFGATGGLVTGSCYRIDGRGSSFLVDAGLVQGKLEERSARGEIRNLTPADKIIGRSRVVFVTHAHIDHTGRLPILHKKGEGPKVFATKLTATIMGTMLENSAQIQESDPKKQGLYTQDDVDKTMRNVSGFEPLTRMPVDILGTDNHAQFVPNGHIEGSAAVFVRFDGINMLMTGDIGRRKTTMFPGYEELMAEKKCPQEPVNVLVVESTNIEKAPVSFGEKKEAFFREIKETWKRGGNPILPTLSLHRAQELMEMLHNGQANGEIPSDCRIVVDAPLAMKILEVYKKIGAKFFSRRYGENANFYNSDAESMNRFNLSNLEIINSHQDSINTAMKYANYKGKAIILASGGMMEYGRIGNYKLFFENGRNKVIQTCFQVAGTPGAEYEKNRRIGKNGAEVVKIEGMSSHACGPDELFGFLNYFNLSELNKVIVVHGSDRARNVLANEFKKRGYRAQVILPGLYQEVVL